eukprot:CAMPEP_0171166862 /NCGR_PEP_ID=MMETSP0790-20130122/6911_1 /TAXON_ID=2925 /ORGANISM="Alexandrium catenella, Strain OF101" /LENGTH=207 /DNA_ID=CAMNT_0011631679 /DNA_START=30 /DNA_END=651 /DNA_ORIENTATION=-
MSDLKLWGPAPGRPEAEELRDVRGDSPRRAVLAREGALLHDLTPHLEGRRLLQSGTWTEAVPLEVRVPHDPTALGRVPAEQLRELPAQIHHDAAPVRATHEHLVEGVDGKVEQVGLVLRALPESVEHEIVHPSSRSYFCSMLSRIIFPQLRSTSNQTSTSSGSAAHWHMAATCSSLAVTSHSGTLSGSSLMVTQAASRSFRRRCRAS